MFPSPIGELHFSMVFKTHNDTGSVRVSVPYRGATFLNLILNIYIVLLLQFPSPIGELHFSIRFDNFIKKHCTVSVPYRGATFLNTAERLFPDL